MLEEGGAPELALQERELPGRGLGVGLQPADRRMAAQAEVRRHGKQLLRLQAPVRAAGDVVLETVRLQERTQIRRGIARITG
jgi:hypothetical protein